MRTKHAPSHLDLRFAGQIASLALRGLDPRASVRRPVLLALELAALAATVVCAIKLATEVPSHAGFVGQVALWLWVALLAISAGMATVEASTHARSRRLRALQSDIPAKSLIMPQDRREDWLYEIVASETLDVGDVVLVEAGDIIPADGEVIDGVAEVDESAVTGELAPVIRESGGDRSAVIGGTRVLSDWLKVKVTADLGHSVFAQMSELIAKSRRNSSSTELWLTLPLLAAVVLAVAAVMLVRPLPIPGTGLDLLAVLIALFGAMLPTATAGLWSVTGIASMGSLVAANIVAKSGTAVEAAAWVDTLLLDKTGTITLGDRSVEAIVPLPGIAERDATEVAYLASLSDDTPEGRSIVAFAERRFGFRPPGEIAGTMPFSAATRMSGATLLDGTDLRKGEPMAILQHLAVAAGRELQAMIDRIAHSGGTPLALSRGGAVVGVAHLKDVVRPGMREQCEELRRMGVRTVMVTGDNRLTAATVAAAAGVDDFVAQASPQGKLQLLREEQAKGRRVGVCGDGANDAPVLAQADLGIALAHGAAAAREAGNMVDLDSDPLKLIEVIRNGRRMAATRRSLTGLAFGADLAKYLVLLSAVFAAGSFSATGSGLFGTISPQSMLLAGCAFSALAILVLLPLAIRVERMPTLAKGWSAMALYGMAGFVLTPIAIMLLQGAATALGLA